MWVGWGHKWMGQLECKQKSLVSWFNTRHVLANEVSWWQVQGAALTFSGIFQAEHVKVGDIITVRTTNYRSPLMKTGGHWQKPILLHPLRCNSVGFCCCFFCFFILNIRVLCRCSLETLNLLMTWTWSADYVLRRKGQFEANTQNSTPEKQNPLDYLPGSPTWLNQFLIYYDFIWNEYRVHISNGTKLS